MTISCSALERILKDGPALLRLLWLHMLREVLWLLRLHMLRVLDGYMGNLATLLIIEDQLPLH